MLVFLTVASLLLACAAVAAGPSSLREVYAWKDVDFTFPDNATRAEALLSGRYLRNATLPLGIERWANKLFITIPRRKAGVPATLGYIDLNSNDRSPLLTPYPDWKTNDYPQDGEPADTPHISSTYRVRADICNRLWVIDTGLADTGTGHVRKVTPPQLLVYDLLTNTLLLNYFFPEDDYKTDSFFANVAVDVTPFTCDDAYAYMPDLGAYGLVVFSLKSKSSWRVNHHYFYFDPLAGNLTIAGINFQWTDGAFSAALSEIKPDGYRTLYFHPMASHREFSVSTKYLRDKELSAKSFNEFKDEGYRGKDSQSTATFYDETTGVLFFMEILRHAVTCWNTRTPLSPQALGVVAKDETSNAFIYPSDVKVDREGNLWVINNNLPVYIYRQVDTSQYNYFVYVAQVKEAIRGTVCNGSTPEKLFFPTYGLQPFLAHGNRPPTTYRNP